MKKILCPLLLLISAISFSQEETVPKTDTELNVVSLEFSAGVGANIGVVFESQNSSVVNKEKKEKNQSNITKIYYSSVTLTSSSSFVNDIDGTGFGLEYGSRYYFGKKDFQGIYLSSYLIYGRYSFDEANVSSFGGETIPFKGKYEYFSIFSPEIGYKLLVSKNFVINLHVGAAWLIETKAQGDVDNQSFDNWAGKFGLALGYSF
uniref:hypothetical protein n=1 Tax=Flavobacterium sp. TaxID=239 RepID=UPI004049EAAC